MATFSREFLRSLAQPSFQQGLFTAARGIGMRPQMQALQQQQQAEKLAEEQRKRGVTGGLLGLQQAIARGEDPTDALGSLVNLGADAQRIAQFSQLGAEERSANLEQEQIKAFQEQVAKTAESAGLIEQAATARSTTDIDELRAISKDVRAFQIEQLPLDNPQVIKARLKMAGFTPAQITAMGTLSAEEADALLKGRTGKLEAWQDVTGKIIAVNVNDFGLVFDDKTDRYVKASELGLVRKAPNVVQQIVDTSQQVGAEKMAEANVEGFIKLHEKATNARDQIAILDRQTARLEGGMPTGLGASVELNLRRIGEFIGLPYAREVTSAENYIAEASKIVAEQIKDFGAGTGLSDADREYAKIGAGADITQQQEALLNLLKIRRGAMAKTVELYNTVRASTAKRLGENNMTVYMPITMPEKPEAPEEALPEGFVMD